MDAVTITPVNPETLMIFSEVVAAMGEGCVSSLQRYARDGKRLADGRRVKLEATVRFGRTLTSPAAVERFIAACQPAYIASGISPKSELPGAAKREATAARKLIRERHGAKSKAKIRSVAS